VVLDYTEKSTGIKVADLADYIARMTEMDGFSDEFKVSLSIFHMYLIRYRMDYYNLQLICRNVNIFLHY